MRCVGMSVRVFVMYSIVGMSSIIYVVVFFLQNLWESLGDHTLKL